MSGRIQGSVPDKNMEGPMEVEVGEVEVKAGEVEVRTVDWRVELVLSSAEAGRVEEPLVEVVLGDGRGRALRLELDSGELERLLGACRDSLRRLDNPAGREEGSGQHE
jgi:hypothetical protein